MRSWGRAALPPIIVLVIGACVAEPPRSGAEEGVAGEELDTAAAGAALAPLGFDTSWVVTAEGVGPVRVGMTTEDVSVVLGGAIDAPDDLGDCGYISPPGLPDGVAVMVVDGRVVRVEVRAGDIATAEGARIGSTEREIHALYPGRVEVRPHKYTAGQYLIVTPAGPAGEDYRIVFETDGRVVERYRAGALPFVEWVEACA
ncbi:MAG TPA: hypothetical protein VF158_12440 [Longimicrobiales bacterium]